MRRGAASLLIGYAAAITVVASWLGCRAYVLQRIWTATLWGRPSGLPVQSYDEIQAFTDIAQRLTDTGDVVDAAAVAWSSLHPVPIAAAGGVAFLGSYALAAVRRRAPRSPAPTPPKD